MIYKQNKTDPHEESKQSDSLESIYLNNVPINVFYWLGKRNAKHSKPTVFS